MSAAESDLVDVNRAHWDGRVPVHAASAAYDLPAFRAGASTLAAFEVAEVGDVSGKRLLHLQCHMGQDTLSWARRGAVVTGLDFSAPAIAEARALAADTQLADRARFVVSDVYHASQALDGQRFSIVYTGVGALPWLPDLPRWARTVASLLDDGGMLYVAEFHPLTAVLGPDGTSVERDYFHNHPQIRHVTHTYTDGPALTHTTCIQWQHPLADVVNAVAQAGLRIEAMREHPTTVYPNYPILHKTQSDGAQWTFPPFTPRTPLMYSLRATRTHPTTP